MHRAKIGAEGGYEPELLREFCGSKSYCPPEMLAAQPYDAFAADVWSLGVCPTPNPTPTPTPTPAPAPTPTPTPNTLRKSSATDAFAFSRSLRAL